MSDQKLYMVETLLVYRLKYVVKAKCADHALDEVTMNIGSFDENWKEFSQKPLDEIINSVREINHDQYLAAFDDENDYLKHWTLDQKLDMINKINYDESE